MSEFWPYLVGMVVVGILIEVIRTRMQRSRDYRKIIEPDLEKLGYEFVSSVTPGLFMVGPFPKIEFKVGGIQTRTPIGSGEFTQFRIVRFRDRKTGEEKESWVKLEFEAFRLSSITWKPHPNDADALAAPTAMDH